jgi:hypothetical protein
MIKGFVAEIGGATTNLPRWVEGEPDPSWWTGGDAKFKQWSGGAKIIAYRCPECKALRLYAPDPS